MEGQISAWHRRAETAWEKHSLPSANDRLVVNVYEAKKLGARIDGDEGTLATTIQRQLDALALSMYSSAVPRPHRMWLDVSAQMWNFVLQFRRPASCCLYKTWQTIGRWRNCGDLPRDAVSELMTLGSLAPALVAKLRSRPDLLVTCSDASMSGAAVAASAGLAEYEMWSAKSLPAQLPTEKESGVSLILLFGGVEAGRRGQ